MATDEDIPNESIQASSDESSQEAAGPDTAKKKAAKKTTKKVTKKKVAKKMAPAPADPAPTESTTPETEAEPMAEETVTSEQHEVSPTVPAAVTLTPVQPPSGSGAAVAQWGPIALLALLIVVFRAGDETSSANAAPAPHPAPAKSAPAVAPAVVPAGSSSGGLSLPPLTLPGSEKLIEGLSAHPWRQGGLGTGEASVAAPPSAAPAIGAQLGGVQAPAIPPQGRWGMRDPAAGYWGQPVPGGYGQGGYSGMQPMPWGYPYGRPADPYWWAQQQAQIPDVLPPAQK